MGSKTFLSHPKDEKKSSHIDFFAIFANYFDYILRMGSNDDIINLVAGMYLAFDLLLGFALIMMQSRFSKEGRPAPAMRIAAFALFCDAVPVSLHAVKRIFLPNAVCFYYIHPLLDLLVTSLFLLSGFSLLSSRYPSAKTLLRVFLPALGCYLLFLITNSILLFSIATILWVFVLFVVTIFRMRRYNHLLNFYYSNADQHRTTWFALILVWAFVVYPCFKAASIATGHADLFYILYSLATMAMEVTIATRLVIQVKDTAPAISNLYHLDSPEEQPQPQSEHERLTADTYFTPAQQQMMKARLAAFMTDEKLYRLPELCVDDLVKRLDTNASYFYYFMRDVMATNFLDYVNSYRIEESKQMLMQGEKIEYIIAHVGFNSDNTFRRAFRKATGLTPSQWRQTPEK